jgi:hypothetical protein
MDFLGKSPRYINLVILWIDLLIVELGFNKFWGFSIDWSNDLVLINDWVFLMLSMSPVLAWPCVCGVSTKWIF